jgi:hypothetical protein
VLSRFDDQFLCEYPTSAEYRVTISNPEILGNALNLSMMGLTSFWGGAARNIKTLELGKSNGLSLDKESFVGMENLLKLNLK